MRLLIRLLMIVFCIPFSWSQSSLLEFDFGNYLGNETYGLSSSNGTNIEESTIFRGPGINASSNGSRFNANNFATTTTYNTTDYFELTITPTSECTLTINEVQTFLQRSSTGPKNIQLRSSLDNYSSILGGIGSINEVTTAINFNFNITSLIPVTFRFYLYNASATTGTGGFEGGGTYDIRFLGEVNCTNSPTDLDIPIDNGILSIDNLNSFNFSVNCQGTSATGTLDFVSDVPHLVGNAFIVEISSENEPFNTTEVGRYEGNITMNFVTFNIPADVQTGNYRIRVRSTMPELNSDFETIYITQLGTCTPRPAYLTSILYDGCDGECGSGTEGLSEILFGKIGTTSVLVNTNNINLYYTTGGYNLLTNVVSNSAKITELNLSAGCTNLFIDANNQVIPAHANILIVSESICISALEWNNLCESGPVYVIFGRSNTSNGWRDNGNFGNSGNAKNFYFETKNTENVTSRIHYQYTPIATMDGNYATFSNENLTTTSSTPIRPAASGNFPDCSLTPIVLNTDLISFSAAKVENEIVLFWKYSENRFITSYLVEKYDNKSADFIEIVSIYSSDTDGIITYTAKDPQDLETENIYRLKVLHRDGKSYEVGYSVVYHNNEGVHLIERSIINPSNNILNIYTLDGRIVQDLNSNSIISMTNSGVIVVHDLTNSMFYKFYIP